MFLGHLEAILPCLGQGGMILYLEALYRPENGASRLFVIIYLARLWTGPGVTRWVLPEHGGGEALWIRSRGRILRRQAEHTSTGSWYGKKEAEAQPFAI
ncbi:hypothetical protein NITGR_250011 [Nitrospina gracilis 3/211]|uniref:Uncharacterized protein n=1 Tax=Nitrospina gracilis (strain 3/211) TaxID=1266370 RepID=M1YXU6_NITG3|nr:hypothetical protein NITGR_250011 [Nitrospina gracilis 3/211]